jgi:hypothetical protein
MRLQALVMVGWLVLVMAMGLLSLQPGPLHLLLGWAMGLQALVMVRQLAALVMAKVRRRVCLTQAMG